MESETMADEILATVRAMNRCWTEGWHEDEFRRYIHPDAIAIVPSEPGRLEGREAYVAGWRGFSTNTVINDWQETDHTVQVYADGKTAVVTYFFSITCTYGTEKRTIKGRDMFFLVRQGRLWLVAADQFSPEPLQNATAQSR